MNDFLTTILTEKKAEIARLRSRASAFGLRTSPRRPFAASLRRDGGELGVIAEVKKASPSKGLICPNFDPVAIAYRYEKGGAAAVSVLTDEKFFQGSTDFLVNVRAAVTLPVLRKDFIVDELQLRHTAHLSADAVLLIVAALSDQQLSDLYHAALSLDVEPLIEVHTLDECERALRLAPPLIGINNRSLVSFEVSLGVTEEIARIVPAGVTVVAESGIFVRDDSVRVRAAGAHAILVGESLMRSEDPGILIKELSCARTD